MKPRIFLGSSSEQNELVGALSRAISSIALGKPWSGDIFVLGQGTIESLVIETKKSDFSIFLFAADDVAKIRGSEYSVARDNVVYELGLFSGALGSERCYILMPNDSDIHLPTDLKGITFGTYDTEHGQELVSALAPFVNTLTERIRTLGFRHKAGHRELYDLIAKYSAADEYLSGTEQERVSARLIVKKGIWAQMLASCNETPPNKSVLLQEHHYVAFAAAIVSNPEMEDYNRLLKVRTDLLKRGDPQAKIVDAMMALRSPKIITDDKRDRLATFADSFQDRDPSLIQQIRNFRNL